MKLSKISAPNNVARRFADIHLVIAVLRVSPFEDPEREATAIWLEDAGVAVVKGG